MRILHTNMLRGWGGQSNRILVEAHGALRAGHQVAFAVPDGAVLAQKGHDVGIDIWPGYHFRPPLQLWRFLPDLRRLLADLDRWKPDIIHLHGSQDTWLVAAAGLLRRRMPVRIRTKHNIFPWSTHAANRWLYNQADGYVAISGYIEREIASYPGLASKPRAIIYSVPDVQRIDAETGNVRHEIPVEPRDGFLWVSTGRLRSEKGFDVLLKAMKLLRETHPAATLAIAGDGSDGDALRTQAQQLQLGKSVAFLGFRRDVPAVLRSGDGYVLASRAEGLGTAILEALAAGLPVVATRVGGIPDSVRHENTGLLAEPEDPESLARSMRRIMDEDDLRRRLAESARRMIREEFAEERLVAQTLEFYERMLKERRDG